MKKETIKERNIVVSIKAGPITREIGYNNINIKSIFVSIVFFFNSSLKFVKFIKL